MPSEDMPRDLRMEEKLSAKLFDPTLHMAAASLDDVEKARIAANNRYKAMTRHSAQEGDEMPEFSLGLSEKDDAVARMKRICRMLEETEHFAILALESAMKRHALGPWIKAQPGIGLKQGARLLAALKDPYWHAAEDRPRLVSELWSYCGYGVDDGAAPRYKAKQQAYWSKEARMRARLVSESCLKQGVYYKKVYHDAREKYAEAVHAVPCAQCTPKGAPPAEPGTSLKDGHKHARALRIVSKEILRDLWTESKRLYDEG